MSLLQSIPVFTQKDTNAFVMEFHHKYFSVDAEVKLVMQVLAKSADYKEAVGFYNIATQEDYTEAEFRYYADEIVKVFKVEQKEESFLLVEKIIFPAKVAGKIAGLFQFLFAPLFFWITFIGLCGFVIYVMFFSHDHQRDNTLEVSVIPFLLLYGLTIFFHEVGHISACRRYTGKNGGIGVGIYLIYPVLYSDISPIWHADRRVKVITNLAGIYMQLWFVPLLLGIGYLFDVHFFEDFVKGLILICFIQIIPFIRSDGYWLLCDLLNIPNLLQKSQAKLNQLIFSPKKFFTKVSSLDVGLVTYAIVNTAFVILFAYYQLRYNYYALLHFPIYFWNLIVNFFTGHWSALTFNLEYFTALLFYYVVYSYGKRLFDQIFSKKVDQNIKD